MRRLWRKRRNFGPYLNTLLDRTEGRGHARLALMVCKSVVTRLKAPRFIRRMERMMQARDEKAAAETAATAGPQ